MAPHRNFMDDMKYAFYGGTNYAIEIMARGMGTPREMALMFMFPGGKVASYSFFADSIHREDVSERILWAYNESHGI